MKMIQRRNSKRFILSELKTDNEDDNETATNEITITAPEPVTEVTEEDPPIQLVLEPQSADAPSSPSASGIDMPLNLLDVPPTLNEIQKWRSIKSLRNQIT